MGKPLDYRRFAIMGESRSEYPVARRNGNRNFHNPPIAIKEGKVNRGAHTKCVHIVASGNQQQWVRRPTADQPTQAQERRGRHLCRDNGAVA